MLNLWVVGLTGVFPPFPYPDTRHTEGLVQMDLFQVLLEVGAPQAGKSESWKSKASVAICPSYREDLEQARVRGAVLKNALLGEGEDLVVVLQLL